MVDIRRATLEDIPQLVQLCWHLYREAPRQSQIAEFEPERAGEFMAGHLDEPYAGWVAVYEGEIVGFLGAYVDQLMFSSKLYASEPALFMLPAFRGNGGAKALIKAYLDWAADKDVIYALIGISSDIHPEKTVSFYKHLGFEDFSTTFMMRFDDEQ